ncbi:MAG: hypothetical protein N2038_13870 [Geminicoccaceae bacterium]|nr:hypothetical protein [Geminicoccaceae bacterium]MCS7266493.1 hypothetical protein [Geminicoccaceae bacterium]MCX7631322.1 hypothetical protein [Geminicoccaceae bacterium]MDW8123911.1 hypothetical protein [Geminicoccaceae bacterium]MDW8340026.1 hypothetical protein [Geminicoccaceae bacterium]
MQESEGLGTLGWVLLAVLLLEVVVALAFGFSKLVYLALPLTVVVFVAMVALCTGTTGKPKPSQGS